MECKRGTALHVTHSISVRGGSAGGTGPMRVFTEHVCTFDIGSNLVRVSSSEAAAIREGDEIVAAGSTRSDGIFAVRAYSNLTNGVSGGYINSRAYRSMGIASIALPLVVAVLCLLTQGKLFAPLSPLFSEGGFVLLAISGAGLLVLGALLIREAGQGEKANQLARTLLRE